MATLIAQLQAEITQKEKELGALKAALAALTGGQVKVRSKAVAKKGGRTWSAAQKAAQAEKMKEAWAKRKAKPARKTKKVS